MVWTSFRDRGANQRDLTVYAEPAFTRYHEVGWLGHLPVMIRPCNFGCAEDSLLFFWNTPDIPLKGGQPMFWKKIKEKQWWTKRNLSDIIYSWSSMLSHLNQDAKIESSTIRGERCYGMMAYGFLFLLFFSQLPKVHAGGWSYPPPSQKFHKGQKPGLALTVFIVFFCVSWGFCQGKSWKSQKKKRCFFVRNVMEISDMTNKPQRAGWKMKCELVVFPNFRWVKWRKISIFFSKMIGEDFLRVFLIPQ